VSGALVRLVRADVRERMRRHSFLITLGLTLYAAYMFLPPNHAPYATLNLAGHRGIYNSAWVGCLVAMLAQSFLTLAGFYLVKNAVERDRRTGVGQILAATPLSGPTYLLSKLLSNFAILSAMVGVMVIAAGAIQLVRGEDTHLQLVTLVSPFILVTLPTMALVAALAVFFEVVPFLRGGMGNVVYFFVWIFGLSLPAAAHQGRMNAPLGTEMFVPQMQSACHAAYPDYPGVTGGLAMGFNIKDHGVWDLQTFVWQGVHWTPDMVAWRLAWLAAALALTMLAALLFDRFDPARSTTKDTTRKASQKASRQTSTSPTGLQEGFPGTAPDERPLTPAPRRATAMATTAVRAGQARFGALVRAELRIMMQGVSRWWYLVALAITVLSLFVPLVGVRLFLLPFAAIWPLLHWSPLGTREVRYGTDALLFSSPRPLTRLLLAQWLAGVLLALAMMAGAATRFALVGQPLSLAALAVGALFVPSLALAFGTWSGSAKLFEVIYLMLWYGGPMNRVPVIDYLGTTQPKAGTAPVVAFLALTIAMMTLALLGRRRQLHR